MTFVTSPIDAQTCDGGMVATEEHETLIYACVNDGEEDEFEFDADNEADDAAYVFIVTNDNNIILKILDDDEADFEDSGVGDCRVYGLSFSGDLLATEGDQITQTILSTSCFHLSSNYITVVRREIEETNVTTSNGGDEIEITDNNNAAFTFINDGQGLANYIYFVIRRSDDRIVGMGEDGFFDFSELEEDRYKVRGYSYSGELLLGVGDRLKGRVSTGCYQKSSSTKVDKEVSSILGDCLPDGGTIKTEDDKTMDYVCVNDGNRDEIDFEFRSIASGDYVFILTDENNMVLEILEDDEFNFDGEDVGIAHIWGVSFHGELLIEEGDALLEIPAIATECGELSENFITIFKDILNDTYIETDEGEVSIKITDNEDAIVTVVNDGGAGNATYFYFLRDNETDKIVAMNDTGIFDMAPFDKGKYFVRGYAYTGEIMVSIGDKLPADISTGCHEKSENVVTIRKEVDAEIPDPCQADAGTLIIDANPVTIMAGIALISATPNGDINVPTNYEILYVLTTGSDFVVQMFSSFSSFSITTPGNYTIHTLVAELNDFASPDFFNPADIVLGVTTSADIVNLIVSQNVCASIDVTGASVEVLPGADCDAAAGTLLADQPLVELGFPPIAVITATHVIAPIIPLGFEIQYFLVKSGNFIEMVGDNPAFFCNYSRVISNYDFCCGNL